MPSLKALRRRLNSVNATLQLSSAMKTVSSVKYSRINKMLACYEQFTTTETELFEPVFHQKDTVSKDEKKIFVLLSGNRGLCGGYNTELFSFFDNVIKGEKDPIVITCGKKAKEHCEIKKIQTIRHFDMPDIPDYENAQLLVKFLEEAAKDGFIVCFVYQKHKNLLKREPTTLPISLNGENQKEDSNDSFLFLPDKKTVTDSILPFYHNSKIYSILLNTAAGVQAATLTAMRSAYDTAYDAAQNLLTEINRKRQSEVTSGVLETRFEETEAFYE